jgi:hypothetical protein
MTKLAQHTIDALIAEIAQNVELRQQAIHDPHAFVKHYFELTEAQTHLIDAVPAAHWHEIAGHLSKVTFKNGGTFTYTLKLDIDQVPGELAKGVCQAGCEGGVESGPNGQTYSARCSAGYSF